MSDKNCPACGGEKRNPKLLWTRPTGLGDVECGPVCNNQFHITRVEDLVPPACGEGDTAQATEQPQTVNPRQIARAWLKERWRDSWEEVGHDVREQEVEELTAFAAPLSARIAELEQKQKQQAQRRFPLMDGPSVPWHTVEEHEAQALKNHSQTVERLAQRGGLSCAEFWFIMQDSAWKSGELAEATRSGRELANRLNSDALRADALAQVLRSIIDIGKRDLTNPKYDIYFEEARTEGNKVQNV